jgi:hypothetical protein
MLGIGVLLRAQVRHILASNGRLEGVVQVIINPSDEAAFNVLSTVSKREDVKVGQVDLL